MKGLDQLQCTHPGCDRFSKAEKQGMHRLFSIWPYRAIRIMLAAVFLWSGVSKLISPVSFAIIIDAYGLIPGNWVTLASIGLPALEVVLAMGLLLDIQGSLAGTAVLLALFMAILGYGIHLGLDVDCGCFGPEDPEAEAFHGLRTALYRDTIMAAAILYLYLWRFVRSAKPVGFFILLKILFTGRDER
ncbi:MAG: DoxX family protein [Deltaproteobacteria bacterium]|nr:DoxX family protein [Deltaproteobacteria bacterium]